MKYPRVLGWSVVIAMWAIMGVSLKYMKNPAIHNANECSDCQEVCNTAEDMIGWIVEDVANGYVDSTYADTYIDNLDGIIINLGVTR
jgi:hypothetical protein